MPAFFGGLPAISAIDGMIHGFSNGRPDQTSKKLGNSSKKGSPLELAFNVGMDRFQ